MKKYLFLVALVVLGNGLTYAQTDADKLQVPKPKILAKLDNLALAQLTVSYKLTSTAKTIGVEKQSGDKAGAKISAYLQVTDGPLTDADFQEITDYFYSYFQKKLKENGIDTVAWATIVATDFYKNAAEKEDDKKDDGKGEKGGNVWVTSTAHKGNILHGGELAFAFGKIKKAAAFSEEIGAPAGFFYVTVDFADVMVHVEIESRETTLIYYVKVNTKTKYTTAVKAEMSVGQSDLGSNLFWNKKSQGDVMFQRKDIIGSSGYHTAISEDASKVKNSFAKLWAFRKEMTPVVIETTKDKYKDAAKKTLEKYADAFVAKAKLLKKS
jgi:hypothetical protein